MQKSTVNNVPAKTFTTVRQWSACNRFLSFLGAEQGKKEKLNSTLQRAAEQDVAGRLVLASTLCKHSDMRRPTTNRARNFPPPQSFPHR
jgi:hypothetical protein